MERKPKPAETQVVAAPEGAAVAEAATPAETVAPVEAPADGVESAAAETTVTDAPALDLAGPADLSPAEVAAAMGILPVDSAPIVPDYAPAETASEPAVAEPNAAAAEPAIAASESVAPQEEQFIEVWRPGRFEGRERHHRRPNRNDRQASQTPSPDVAAQPVADGAQVQSAEAGATPAGDNSAPQRERHHRRRPPNRGGERHERPDGQRPRHGKGKPRFEGNRRNERNERSERNDHGGSRERVERQPDPNSPFAKLAALKAQLEADSKERR
jgi:ATP-dependent RNA helicase SUPV3L1/SUV3